MPGSASGSYGYWQRETPALLAAGLRPNQLQQMIPQLEQEARALAAAAGGQITGNLMNSPYMRQAIGDAGAQALGVVGPTQLQQLQQQVQQPPVQPPPASGPPPPATPGPLAPVTPAPVTTSPFLGGQSVGAPVQSPMPQQTMFQNPMQQDPFGGQPLFANMMNMLGANNPMLLARMR